MLKQGASTDMTPFARHIPVLNLATSSEWQRPLSYNSLKVHTSHSESPSPRSPRKVLTTHKSLK